MVFEIINRNWGDIILELHCFHCRNIKATVISSIKVNNWLTSSEYNNLSKVKLLIPEWFFSVWSSECRLCIHCNRNPSNWSVVENVFFQRTRFVWQEWWMPLQEFLDSWTQQEYDQACSFVSCDSHPWEHYDECKRTINNSRTNVGVVVNHVKIRPSFD